MMRRLLTLSFLVLASIAFAGVKEAKAKTCCVCETGQQGFDFEKPFFRAGCRLWLQKQKRCDLKKITELNRNLDQIPRQCDGGEVKLGFVGHWASVYQSTVFINDIIDEGMSRRGMSFDIDNTACYAMDKPEVFKDHIQKTGIPEGQYLRFTGNQILSVGTWDDIPVAFGRSNVYASYDSRTNEVTYPSCDEFKYHKCSATFGIQRNQSARCRNESGQLEEITCCSVTYEVNQRLSRGPRMSSPTRSVTANLWVSPNQCGQIVNR